MRGGQGPGSNLAAATGTERSGSVWMADRTKSAFEGGIPAARVLTGMQQQPFHEAGHVTSERIARLCGDHLEHCYEAQRLTTHGTTCVSVAFHTETPTAAGQQAPAQPSWGPACARTGPKQLLVCATSTNSIAVFDAATSTCIEQHTKGSKRCSSAFTPSLSHVAVYGDPMAPAIELQLCNLGKYAWLEGHTVEVRNVDLTPDGNTIISCGRGGQVHVWQVQHVQQPQQQPQKQQQQGSTAAVTSEVKVTRHALQGHSPTTQVKACCLSADGQWAATGGSDGKVLLWDLSALSDMAAAVASTPTGSPPAPAQQSKHNSCCVPGPPGLAKLAAEWQLGQLGREHTTCLGLSADGSVLAVGMRTGKVHVALACNTNLRQLVQLPMRHTDGYKVRCVALSPDASKLVSTADDARMVLWDVSTRSCMLSIHEHTKPVRGCCWSPNGKHICSVGDDNLLIVHDVVILNSSSGSSSKVRMGIRLDGCAAWTAAEAAAEAEAAGEAAQSSGAVLRHPCLTRMDVSMLKERLLACAPAAPASIPSSCNDSMLFSASKPEGAAAGLPDAVLCVDQAGQILLLPPASTAAMPTGACIGSNIACCCFDGSVVAAAKRDGSVTVMSCHPGHSTQPTPIASATAGAGATPAAAVGSGDGAAPTAHPPVTGPGAAMAQAAAAAVAAVSAGKQQDQQIAVSAKMDMLVLGISVCKSLGRVALAGSERKNTQNGVLYLWEFDPSVRPAALAQQGTLRGLSGIEQLPRQHSNRSMLSSVESADDSITSPNWVSIDFEAGLSQGKTAVVGSPLAAKARRLSNGNAAHVRLSNASSSTMEAGAAAGAGPAGAAPPAAPSAPSASAPGAPGSPHGWLWHCDNPVKVMSAVDAPMLCCAWTKGPELPKLVVGSAAGWVVVVDCEGEDMEESLCRYKIHDCNVSAIDCSADGSTVVTGGSNGHIVLWSHVTGFKLAVFTLHSAVVRSLAFNHDSTLLAAGDTDGVVSAWDVPQSCLLSAAQVHEGYVSSCCWSSTSTNTPPASMGLNALANGSSGSSGKGVSLISCSYDGTISVLQVDPSIYRQYCAAFCGLYYSCKKNNKLQKLEGALNWHLQHGALQDASVLQLLMVQAAADGNAAIMGLLLPMFEKRNWLLHFGPIFARPTLAGFAAASLRKTDSNQSLNANTSKHERRQSRKHTAEMAAQPATALQAYQPNAAPSAAAAVAAGTGISLGLEDYVIHPHDRGKVTSSHAGSRGGSLARRTTDRLLAEKGHKRSGSYGDSPERGASFLDGSVITQPRNSRWAHSVADIKTMLAFSSSNSQQPHHGSSSNVRDAGARPPQFRQLGQQRQQLLQQQSLGASQKGSTAAGSAASFLLSPMGQSSFNGSSIQQGSDAGESSGPGSLTFPSTSIRRSGSGGVDSDTSTEGARSIGPDSPRATQSPSRTPNRLLSPSVSRNARASAQLPVLDTLHEESQSRTQSMIEGGSGGAGSSSRRSTVGIAAAARALIAGSPSGRNTAESLPDSCGNSPRHVMFPSLSPRHEHDLLDPPDLRFSRGSDSISLGPSAASPSPNNFLNQLLRSARGSQQQQDGSPRNSDAASGPLPLPQSSPSPLQRQGSGSHLPPLPQQQPHLQEQLHRNSMARQVAALVSNRWLHRWGSRDKGQGDTGISSGPEGHSGAALPVLSAIRHAPGNPGEGDDSSTDVSPGAFATVTAAGDTSEGYEFNIEAQQGSGSTGLQQFDSSGNDAVQPYKQNSARGFLLRLKSSISQLSSRAATTDALPDPAAIRAAASGLDYNEVKSAFSAASAPSKFDGLAASKKKLLASWASWRDSNKATRLKQPSVQQQLLQRPPMVKKRLSGAASQRADLLQVAMASQQAQVVRLVVDALLEGRFSKVSVVLHMYEALQALIHDPQHKRTCRRLLKHLPMIDNGEVEVDSLLVYNTKIIYKCSAHGHTGNLWRDAISSHQALLDALDVLVKHSSWRDSIVALLMWPVLRSLRYLGASWLWLWARQGLRLRHRVQVSAASKLVPVAHAAEIRPSSRGNLLRQLLSANVEADLFGKELVRAVINVKWESFARAFLLMQFVQFLAYFILFLAYMSVAVYGNDPNWTTSELIAYPQGRAALALECILMIMMFGQAADEAKQMVTYKQDYFNSPWNYFDCASIAIVAILFLLHISRLNHQLFIILMALELLLLCMRMLYFCMAAEKVGALVRMVLIVIKDMRYFFLMLVFLLVSFGLTFSVLMSPVSSEKLNLVSLVTDTNGQVANSEVQVFGSLEDSILQLFTIMFGDMQFSTLRTILSVNTVASRLAVFMVAIYAVLVLIVLINLLIAIVDETYEQVKESESDQILRNKALIVDEIESTLTDAVIKDLNGRVLLPYVHILVPQAARPDQQHRSGDLHTKFRKLKQFIKQSMHEQAAASAAAAAASAAQKHGQHGSIDAGLAARGGHGSSTDGAAPAPLSAVAAAAAALAAGRASAVGLAPGNSSSGGGADTGDPPPRPHQLRPNSLSGPVGWASLRRHSAGGQNEQSRSQQFEREEQVDLVASVNAGLSPAQADAAAAVVSEPGNMGALTLVADGLQHNLQEVSSTVSSLSQQVDSVAATSAAAVAELSTKLDSLQSDVGQMKQLLMALLERQQN